MRLYWLKSSLGFDVVKSNPGMSLQEFHKGKEVDKVLVNEQKMTNTGSCLSFVL